MVVQPRTTKPENKFACTKLKNLEKLCFYPTVSNAVTLPFIYAERRPTLHWPNSMALLTISTESALTEAGNSVLTESVFHGLAATFASARAYSALLGILRLPG